MEEHEECAEGMLFDSHRRATIKALVEARNIAQRDEMYRIFYDGPNSRETKIIEEAISLINDTLSTLGY